MRIGSIIDCKSIVFPDEVRLVFSKLPSQWPSDRGGWRREVMYLEETGALLCVTCSMVLAIVLRRLLDIRWIAIAGYDGIMTAIGLARGEVIAGQGLCCANSQRSRYAARSPCHHEAIDQAILQCLCLNGRRCGWRETYRRRSSLA